MKLNSLYAENPSLSSSKHAAETYYIVRLLMSYTLSNNYIMINAFKASLNEIFQLVFFMKIKQIFLLSR